MNWIFNRVAHPAEGEQTPFQFIFLHFAVCTTILLTKDKDHSFPVSLQNVQNYVSRPCRPRCCHICKSLRSNHQQHRRPHNLQTRISHAISAHQPTHGISRQCQHLSRRHSPIPQPRGRRIRRPERHPREHRRSFRNPSRRS